MIKTTLCYLEHGGQYLMLHRVKKENDLNHDKWIGVGGKFEEGESADDCLLREVREETGLELASYELRGIVEFISDVWPAEEMYLYTARPVLPDGADTPLPDCAEGVLEWVDIPKVPALPLWEGDRIFLKKLAAGDPFFRLRLEYEGDRLIQSTESL